MQHNIPQNMNLPCHATSTGLSAVTPQMSEVDLKIQPQHCFFRSLYFITSYTPLYLVSLDFYFFHLVCHHFVLHRSFTLSPPLHFAETQGAEEKWLLLLLLDCKAELIVSREANEWKHARQKGRQPETGRKAPKLRQQDTRRTAQARKRMNGDIGNKRSGADSLCITIRSLTINCLGNKKRKAAGDPTRGTQAGDPTIPLEPLTVNSFGK